MNKSELRQFIRMQKRQFTSQQLCELSLPVMSHLLAHPRVKAASIILMYYSLADEVNTHEAIDQLREAGKQVLLPAVVSDTEMELRCYESKDDLQGGFFDIMEPVGRLFTDYPSIDVAVVPGMSFDLQNNRLGRGKGYYDRFLPLIPQAYKIGVCFDFQRMPGIPADLHDMKVDEVI